MKLVGRQLLSLVITMFTVGCSKESKVESSIQDTFESDAALASALCGTNVEGLDEVSVTSLALSGFTGTANVSGKPLKGGAACSGSISFMYGASKGKRIHSRKARSTSYHVAEVKVTSSSAAPKP